MALIDVQTLISNLMEGFNRNFFDQDQQLFFLKTDIKKIGKIFTINNNIKCHDQELSSKKIWYFKK